MYSSQEELAAMAAAAKRSLEGQQQKPSDDIYAGLFDDEEETTTPQVNTRIENVPQNIETQEYESSDKETLERLNVPGPHIDPYDDVLFPGGPTKSDIQLWKKEWEGYDIYVTEILNETFVFRTLNRFEYKQLVSFTDINALQREESICETVTLWPKNYDYSTMAVSKAGIPSTYSEIIMEKSGFTKDIAIQEI